MKFRMEALSNQAMEARMKDRLEGMQKFDLGGLEVSYSAGDHTGLDFADLSIIGSDGKFRR